MKQAIFLKINYFITRPGCLASKITLDEAGTKLGPDQLGPDRTGSTRTSPGRIRSDQLGSTKNK